MSWKCSVPDTAVPARDVAPAAVMLVAAMAAAAAAAPANSLLRCFNMMGSSFGWMSEPRLTLGWMQVDGLKHLGEGHPACLWMAAAAGLAGSVGDGPLCCTALVPGCARQLREGKGTQSCRRVRVPAPPIGRLRADRRAACGGPGPTGTGRGSRGQTPWLRRRLGHAGT